jgi:hypothetical protein
VLPKTAKVLLYVAKITVLHTRIMKKYPERGFKISTTARPCKSIKPNPRLFQGGNFSYLHRS